MGSIDRFDINLVTQMFEACLKDEDDIFMDEYLKAFEEINKFFQLIGSVFAFVSSDVRSKLDILLEFLRDDEEHFSSFKTMIEYEKNGNLFENKKYVSGSRTLLRLHRGLEFVYEFLLRLKELKDTDSSQHVCKSAYSDTLAKHHGFVVRKGAAVAMYALPTKGELLKRVCINVEVAIEHLPEMLQYTKTVYDRTDKLYTQYDLHGLP